MALNPWEYADKTGNEHAHQVALFMWSNMACRFGLVAAEDPLSYSKPGHALANYGPAQDNPNAIPKLFWLHAIKNQGHGDAVRGAKSAAEGVTPGVPDMFLPVPIRDYTVPLGMTIPTYYCGLYIELKRPASVGKRAGKTENVQDYWSKYLKGAGYRSEVCYGWLEARACICRYLELTLPSQ